MHAASVEGVHELRVRRVHSGELRARRAERLAFEADGRVEAVHVEEGERVEAGQPLVVLESDRHAAALEALRARRAAEGARLEELEAGPRTWTVDAARADLRALDERVELARARLERRSDLVASRVLALEELDEARTDHATRSAEREAAAAHLAELEEGTRAEELVRQRALVAELDALVRDAELALADRVLRAPFAGVITHRLVDEGAVVAPGDPALRLLEDTALEARIGVPLESARGLEPGAPVSLQIGDESLTAVVSALVPELDRATRTIAVLASLSPDDSVCHLAGEIVRLSLEERQAVDGFWLPTEALVPGTRGLWSAYAAVPDGDAWRIERRELEILHTEGQRTLVRGTLHPSDRVVLEGVHRVVPGQRVLPTP